jgi:hypothetical protein
MRKTLACCSNYTPNIIVSAFEILIDISKSYRPPLYAYINHKCDQTKINPYEIADIENQLTNKKSQLNTLYKNFPASNPNFFIGSFSMNSVGILVQLGIFLFLSENTERDSDVSGIVTILPKNPTDIPACLSILILKDMLHNMIEIGVENRVLLTGSLMDKLSLFSFSAMRTSNYIRFPNYLHNNNQLTCITNLALHSTSVLCSGFFLENILSSAIKTPSIDSLNTNQKKLAISSNYLFSAGALIVLGISLANIISMNEKRGEPSVILVTALGFTKMLLFLVANYFGNTLYKSLEQTQTE